MPLQAGVNSHLSRYLENPLHAAFISFLGGFLLIIIVCVATQSFFPSVQKINKVPFYLFFGGLLGVIFVITTIILAPKLGATVLISCLITGQLTASIVLDHYGMLGFPVHQASIARITGVLFLITGVVLVKTF